MNSCPHCGSTALVEDQSTGEVVCQACGHVVSRAPSTGPPLPAEGSSWGGRRDAGGGERIKRLLRLDRRLEGPRGRRHLEAWGEMRRISEALNLPRIALETAYVFYSEAQERGLLRRGSLLGFSAASVYAACRALDIPRTLKEVAEASMVGLREVRRTYRVMASTLGLPVGPTSPTVFLAQLSQSNGLSYPLETRALRILLRAMEEGIHVGKNPKGVAAAAVYLACQEAGQRCTKTELAKQAGVSTLTLRRRVKELEALVGSTGSGLGGGAGIGPSP